MDSTEMAKVVFEQEVAQQKSVVMSLEDAENRIDAMDKKVIHTNEVIQDGMKVADELSLNQSTKDFAHIALLDHDIGRFAQMRYTGTYRDSDLNEMMGIKNHGVLGKIILNTRIQEQLPHMKIYHEPIKQIVQDHVDKVNDDKELLILASDLLKNYSMEEILSSDSYRQSVISAMTQVVQDVDRLDIYHQILDGRWTPIKVDDDIDPKVFKMFYNGEYLNMATLKEQGLWNPNVGELVRLGFINQIKLRSVAVVIQKENIIMRLKEKRNNPKVGDVFDYMNEKLNQMIDNTTDGVTVKAHR